MPSAKQIARQKMQLLKNRISHQQNDIINLNGLMQGIDIQPLPSARMFEQEVKSRYYGLPTFSNQKRNDEVTIDEIARKIDRETLFLFAFVPFVIAEVAWDYADTSIDCAIIMRQHETKRICRRIRQLRADYDYIRKTTIDKAHRELETENMIAFQEDYKRFFSLLNTNIQINVESGHPGLCADAKMLISASYSCAVVLKAMFKYVGYMERKIMDLLGIETMGSIIVKPLRELDKIILQFAGEESINSDNKFPAQLQPFVDTLCDYLKQSEIFELPCPVEDNQQNK